MLDSLRAVPLIPDDRDWDYRFQAQDHFASLEGHNVFVEIEVGDVVRRKVGLVVSGEISASLYPLLLWARMHGVPEAVAVQIERNDLVACIGSTTVTAPAGPYIRMQATSEDEVEVEASAIPLIVDVRCTHSWHRK
jgi:hypothetical protein